MFNSKNDSSWKGRDRTFHKMIFLLIRWFSSQQEKQRQEGARTLQLEEARNFFSSPGAKSNFILLPNLIQPKHNLFQNQLKYDISTFPKKVVLKNFWVSINLSLNLVILTNSFLFMFIPAIRGLQHIWIPVLFNGRLQCCQRDSKQ